jgi:hypothetical protein
MFFFFFFFFLLCFGTLFRGQIYIHNLNNYDSGLKRLSDLRASSSSFNEFLANACRDPRLKDLQVQDMLIKPFQRLTKYVLLLKVRTVIHPP